MGSHDIGQDRLTQGGDGANIGLTDLSDSIDPPNVGPTYIDPTWGPHGSNMEYHRGDMDQHKGELGPK